MQCPCLFNEGVILARRARDARAPRARGGERGGYAVGGPSRGGRARRRRGVAEFVRIVAVPPQSQKAGNVS